MAFSIDVENSYIDKPRLMYGSNPSISYFPQNLRRVGSKKPNHKGRVSFHLEIQLVEFVCGLSGKNEAYNLSFERKIKSKMVASTLDNSFIVSKNTSTV